MEGLPLPAKTCTKKIAHNRNRHNQIAQNDQNFQFFLGHFCDDNSGQRWLKASWLHCKGHSRNCPPVWRCGNGNLDFHGGFAGYDIIYIYIYARIYVYVCIHTSSKTSHYLSWFCVPGTLYRKTTVTHTHTQRIINPLCQSMSWSIIYYVMGVCAVNTICLGQRCTSLVKSKSSSLKAQDSFKPCKSPLQPSHIIWTQGYPHLPLLKKILSRIQFELKCFLRENGPCLTPPDTLF